MTCNRANTKDTKHRTSVFLSCCPHCPQPCGLLHLSSAKIKLVRGLFKIKTLLKGDVWKPVLREDLLNKFPSYIPAVMAA